MNENIYHKKEIISSLQEQSSKIIKLISEQANAKFNESVDKKWSTAQQLDHLTKSIKPLVLVLGKPKFIMQLLFGKANRDSRNFNAVVEKYNLKLGLGGAATGRFIPKTYKAKDKKRLLDKYVKYSEKLERIISPYQETNLDKYILPHPLLGKLTIREMMFFTIYHTQHHYNSLNELYG